MDDSRPRNAKGQFEKGQPAPKGARRKRGTPNKITDDIRRDTIAGLARHGSNGHGEGGFQGYIYYLAKRHPKHAARLVEKILPATVNASGSGFGASVTSVNIVSVPSDNYLSPADIAKLRAPALLELEAIASPRDAPEPEPQSPEEARLIEELEGLSYEELLQRAQQAGILDVVPR